MGLAEIPVVDFSKGNLKPGTDSGLPACDRVRGALEEFGCFVAVYDQVPFGVRHSIFGSMKELFDLPIEIKRQNVVPKPYHGYKPEAPPFTIHQAMGIDHVTSIQEIQKFANIMWPQGNQNFCESVHCYANVLAELEQTVMRMVLESYGIENDSHIGPAASFLIRLLKYRIPEMEESNLGSTPHCDKSFISILHQNQPGLEVQTKGGKWIRYEHPSSPDSAFLVMAGEPFMGWSNGRIRACRHRVVVDGNETRYSIGHFSFTNGVISVPEKLVDDDHPLLFKPFDHIGLIHFLGTEGGRDPDTNFRAYCGLN